MKPTLHHIDLRVRDIETTLPLYDAFLSELGFGDRATHTESSGRSWHHYKAADETASPRLINITLDPKHIANENGIAFYVDDQAAVDRISDRVAAAGATDIEPPELWPDYGERYYGLFFRDTSGNRWEIATW